MAKDGKIGCAILRLLTRPLAALPLGFHRAAGRFFGRLAGGVLRYRRDVVMINLAKSFPEKSYSDLREICDRFYLRLGTIVTEAIWFGGCSAERLRKSGIGEITNPEVLDKYFEEGRSTIVMSSHNGNWEIYAGHVSFCAESALGYPENDMCVAYKKLSNPAWERFMYANRIAPVADRKNYTGLVETHQFLRYALSHKNTPKMYIFITDQYPYTAASAVWMEDKFLSQKTRTMNGAAALAHKLGLPVVYLNMAVKEDGNYSLTYTPICDDGAQVSTEEILAAYYRLVEKDVRQQPWNYLWTHKRWKI